MFGVYALFADNDYADYIECGTAEWQNPVGSCNRSSKAHALFSKKGDVMLHTNYGD